VTDGRPVFNRFGKMLPLARAELFEGSWATARGKHQGVLGFRDLSGESNYAPSHRLSGFFIINDSDERMRFGHNSARLRS
jgi:hypothetical protein